MTDDRLRGTGGEAEGLRDDFRALREEVEASGNVPDFQGMMRRARAEAGDIVPMEGPAVPASTRPSGTDRGPEAARRDLVRIGRWIPVAAAAAVAGLLFFGGEDADGEEEFERLVANYSTGAAGWRSPTASLMDIPGVDLGSVPTFGSTLPDLNPAATNNDEGRDS